MDESDAGTTKIPTTATGGGQPSPTQGPSTAMLALGAVLLALAVGVGGYFIGHSAADAGGASDRGVATGQEEIRAEYAKGTPGYKAIYDDGYSAGESHDVTGTKAGASEALGNFTDWEDGALYIVKAVDNNQTEVPTIITQRRLMELGTLYELCPKSPQEICTSPAPPKTGG
ncbi:MAG: hypothetical protein NTV40_00090 [Solirubrobacterales bacterium]|nr:hypothetical protein [Solirubrobacterales bacterium]